MPEIAASLGLICGWMATHLYRNHARVMLLNYEMSTVHTRSWLDRVSNSIYCDCVSSFLAKNVGNKQPGSPRSTTLDKKAYITF